MSTKTLEQLQKEADAANQALAEGRKLKAESDKKAVLTKLESAQTAFSALDKESQAAVLSDPAIRLILATFEISDKKKRKGKRGGKYDETALTAFIGEGKPQGEVQAHFGVSNPTMLAWGKKLVAAGLIKIEDDKTNATQNFWRKKV